jgi:ribosomal protein uS13
MARLAGVDLPRDKRMEIALTYIYGIGRTRSQEILNATGISYDLRTKDLSDTDLRTLGDYITESLKVEGDLRREVQADIRRKIEIGANDEPGNANCPKPCLSDPSGREGKAEHRTQTSSPKFAKRDAGPTRIGKP